MWGLNYPFVKWGVSLSPPLWFAFLRTLVGLIVATTLSFAMKTKGRLAPRQAAFAFFLGIPGTAMFIGFWSLATTQVEPGLISVSLYTYPLWTLFLSIPILKDFPSTKRMGAAFLGFLGVALTSQIGFVRVPASELGAVAELVMAGSGFALMGVCFKRLFKGEQLVKANTWQLAGALVTLTMWAAFTTPMQGIKWNMDLLVVLIWTGVMGTALAYMAFFTLMSRYGAASLTAYLFLVVVVALVGSFVAFGETIDSVQAAGVAAIIIAIYLVGQSDRPKRTENLPAK